MLGCKHWELRCRYHDLAFKPQQAPKALVPCDT